MNKRKILIFLILTFLTTYFSWGFLIINGNLKFGEPIFMIIYVLGGFGPTISAIVTNLLIKTNDKKVFFKSIIKYKIGYWYIPIALSVIITPMISYAVNYIINRDEIINMKFMNWYMIFPLLIAMTIGGGLEELGWRGVLLQEINEKYNKIKVTAIIWILWTIWHLPLFYIKGVSQNGLSFLLFAINVLLLTIFVNWIYTNTKSIFACILFHSGVNAMLAMGFIYGKQINMANIIELCTRGLFFFIVISVSNSIRNKKQIIDKRK